MKYILGVIAALCFSTQAFGYGAAGCGLGSMVFEGKSQWWEQVLAATTNGTSGNQTFGITSGTLNCDASPLIDVSHIEKFVESNKNTVANDISRGNGETMAVLSYAFKCGQDNLSQGLKQNYGKIFTGQNDTASDVANRINSVVATIPGCASI